MSDADEPALPQRSETKRIAHGSGGIKRVVHRVKAVPGPTPARQTHRIEANDTPREQTLPTVPQEPSATASPAPRTTQTPKRQLPQDTGDRWIGKTIHNLKLLRCIGKGGFGAVYQAEHIQLKTFFAVKIVNLMRVGSEEFAERFLREARVIAQLAHPNIVGVSDFGFVEDADCAYMVMDYLHGESLEDRLSQRGQLSKADMLSILKAVCEALTYIHQRGLIHRDLKPSNIFLASQPDGPKDMVKLLDFGIVAQEGESNLTTTGIWLGSPRYMSPEQASGEAHKVDARADLYSLGVVVFELLTNTQLFLGTSVSLIQHHAFTPAPMLRDRRPDHVWAPALEDLFQRLLSKEPSARPEDAESLWQELAPLLQNQPLPTAESALPTGRVTAQLQPPSATQKPQQLDATFDAEAMPGQETLATHPISSGGLARWMWLPIVLLVGLGGWFFSTTSQPSGASDQKITIKPLPEAQRAATKIEPRQPAQGPPTKRKQPQPAPQPPVKRSTDNIARRRRPKATVRKRRRRRRRRRKNKRRRTRQPKRTQARALVAAATQLSVSIISTPSRAAVWHRGKLLGRTPLLFEGKPGQRLSLQFKKAGYITAKRRVTLTRSTTVVRMTLHRDPFKGVKLKLP